MGDVRSTMSVAVQFCTPPSCRSCGGQMHFDMTEGDYSGKVRLACDCGYQGQWHDYETNLCSVPEMWSVLRSVLAAQKAGGSVDG